MFNAHVYVHIFIVCVYVGVVCIYIYFLKLITFTKLYAYNL